MPNTRRIADLGSPDEIVEIRGKFRINPGAQILAPGQTDVPTVTSIAPLGENPTLEDVVDKVNEMVTKFGGLDLQLISLGTAKAP